MMVLAGLPFSQASQLPQLIFSGANFLGPARSMWEPGLPVRVVGQSMMVLAGLPLSQASQLPQLIFSGANFFGTIQITVGAGLACEGGVSVDEGVGWAIAFAGKPAPTVDLQWGEFPWPDSVTVGAGLARDGGGPVDEVLADPPLSQASQPHLRSSV
jgi:hypothetical protein